MTKRLSDSENIVIREIFKNPQISLVEIAEVLEKAKERQTRKSDKKVDVRTVSKFKSVGLRKIKQGLEDLADVLRLDRSVQGESKEEIELQKEISKFGSKAFPLVIVAPEFQTAVRPLYNPLA